MPLLGVVFDFDGVIADTEALHLRAYQTTLADSRLSLSKTDYFDRYLGYDDVGVFTGVARDHGVILQESQLTALIETKGRIFDALLTTDQILFPGSADCILRLAATTKLAIASGALHDEIERILVANALRASFEIVVAADDVERAKPSPDGYLQAVSYLSQADDTSRAGSYVAIEDSQWGLEAARAAGLKTVGITNTYPGSKLTAADVVVDSLAVIDHRFLEALLR